MLRAVSWVFLAGLLVTNAIANVVGRNAEFQADRRVVEMGFGRPLANALRRVMDTPTTHATRWERLWYSHPPARLRVVRIEALLRRRARWWCCLPSFVSICSIPCRPSCAR